LCNSNLISTNLNHDGKKIVSKDPNDSHHIAILQGWKYNIQKIVKDNNSPIAKGTMASVKVTQ
jgi:hypothetical protein